MWLLIRVLIYNYGDNYFDITDPDNYFDNLDLDIYFDI